MTVDWHKPLNRVFGDRPLTATPLAGGLTNRNYRVEVGGEVFALRLAGDGTELLGIDREREVACSRLAAALGVGPEVVAHLPEYRALLTRFLPGVVLTEESARRPAVLRRVAEAVRRYHTIAPADLGRFSPFAVVRDYLAEAARRGASIPEAMPSGRRRLDEIESAVHTDEPLCLCHNDLLAANLLDDGSAVRIIDWEFGGLGDRFFDLGNLAVNLQLGPDEEALLLEAYFGTARPDDLRRLRLMRLASDLREAAWGVLQSVLSKLHTPSYYLAYGEKHLARFLAGAAT